jgi:tight adherence protein C
MTLAIGCATAVTLIGWLLRPRPAPRLAARRAPRPHMWWIGGAVVAVMISPLIGLFALISATTLNAWFVVQRKARAERNIIAHFPQTLDLLVLSIRAGYLPAQAIVEITPFLVAPLRPSFSAVAEAMERGVRFADAINELTERLGPISQPLVDSLSAADRYGLPLAPVLDRLAFEARQQRRRTAEAAARELPVKLALPLVLCTLPSFVLLAIVPLLLGALSSLRT